MKNVGIGDVDAFVQERQAYDTKEKLYEAFAAEQIDALAIVNMENYSGFILGGQTGIGNGRVMASVIDYQALHDHEGRNYTASVIETANEMLVD